MVVVQITNPSNLSDLLFLPKNSEEGTQPKVLFTCCSGGGHNDDGASSKDNGRDHYIGPIHVTQGVGVAHGFDVVANRDIEAGECLFVTQPALSAGIPTVFQEWKTQQQQANDKDTATTTATTAAAAAATTTTTGVQPSTVLERITEQVLVRAMKQCIQSQDPKDQANAQSVLMQLAAGDKVDTRHIANPNDKKYLLDALVGRLPNNDNFPTASISSEALLEGEGHLLNIIRTNAFGPDFTSYEAVEHQWKATLLEDNDNNCSHYPSRLLGLYPLAAMINHSCVPNAVRVFAGEWMLVHATSTIKQGEEVVWSYLPPVLPFPQRRQQLQQRHGFVCTCIRCQNEAAAEASSSNSIFVLPESLQAYDDNRVGGSLSSVTATAESRLQFTRDLLEWEQSIFANNSSSSYSNETRRYWKMGNANFWVQYLNTILMDLSSNQQQHSPQEMDTIRESLLKTAMELHFCFVTCHFASTEHISVLHLCYELVAIMHSKAITATGDPTKTLPKVRFWTEQLKRAHLTRYGSLGNNVEHVRAIMKHTQMVLRNKDGLQKAPFDFI
jgi:hypothetical protein